MKAKISSSLLNKNFFDGHKITHTYMIFVLMAQFIPLNPIQIICFFLAHCQNPCHDFPFSLGKKRKEKVTVTLIGYFNDCLFTETSTVSAQEEPSLVLEKCCHPDETTMERHIFNDVLTLCSKNGKKSRKQRISECITWYNYCSYGNITELLSRLMKAFVFFDRETRSTLWNLLNINIPWMNMEVWETSIVRKPVFSQGCTVNTCLSSAPLWTGLGPKIRVASYLQDFLVFWGLMNAWFGIVSLDLQ